MFEYKILGSPSQQVVLQVNQFFELDSLRKEGKEEGAATIQPHFLQISELNNSNLPPNGDIIKTLIDDRQRKQIIQKYLDEDIEEGGENDKIKSNILFEAFVKKMGSENISRTKFGIIIKGMLQAKRENTGIYFLNVKFKSKLSMRSAR
jgi:hypothetical protein